MNIHTPDGRCAAALQLAAGETYDLRRLGKGIYIVTAINEQSSAPVSVKALVK